MKIKILILALICLLPFVANAQLTYTTNGSSITISGYIGSIKTVETHRALLKERLDIHTVAGLVRYALRVGLIS